MVFGLHAVRAVLARRPKDVLRLAIVAGRDDARVRELARELAELVGRPDPGSGDRRKIAITDLLVLLPQPRSPGLGVVRDERVDRLAEEGEALDAAPARLGGVLEQREAATRAMLALTL